MIDCDSGNRRRQDWEDAPQTDVELHSDRLRSLILIEVD